MNPTRYTGLESVVFDGSESLSSSKFAMVFDILKSRIAAEQEAYSVEEVKDAGALVELANNLQMLFVTVDSPLYSTQSGIQVNMEADRLVRRFQRPLGIQDVPYEQQAEYSRLYNEATQLKIQRNKSLSEYVDIERFLRQSEADDRFDVSCLMGMSERVRHSLDLLAQFNRMITERFNLMQTRMGDDNVYKVNFVLGNIPEFERFHSRSFPQKANRRLGDYEKVFAELQLDMLDFTPFVSAYNFQFD